MAIVSYIDFVNNYLIKNGLIGNATNMNKAADQLKKEIDEVIAGNKGTDILTKLKTVDGTGSGLDADLLDGKDSASTNIVNTIVARDGAGNFSAGTITAALTGNASTASTLQTARTINGEAFDGSANITVSDSTAVKLTGNQTIAGTKTFNYGIVGNITGNASTASTLQTARTINGVSFDGSANITVSDSTAVKLTGNQTIAGTKTFSSSPIVPNPTTGTQAANKDYADLKVALANFTGANVSLAENGYQKLPSGLIIQWGSAIINASTGAYLFYPIVFPNGRLQVAVSHEQVGGSGNTAVVEFGNDKIYINNQFLGSVTARYIAIGY